MGVSYTDTMYDGEFICYECAKEMGVRRKQGYVWYSQVGPTGMIHGEVVVDAPMQEQCICCKQKRNFIIEAECLVVKDE